MTVLLGLATRLRLARLGFVTPVGDGGPAWERRCREWFAAGVDLVLIEQPGLDEAGLRAAVVGGLRAGFGRGRILGLAWPGVPAVGVDLLHLSTAQSTAVDPERFPLVGRPAESVPAVVERLSDPSLAYVTVGPVRADEDVDLRRGLELVATAAATAPPADPAGKPWFASGGIDNSNLEAVLAAGARRVLVRRAIADSADPLAEARRWSDRLRQLWRRDPGMRDYAAAARQSDRGD
ncbi:MAG: thiamine phosphate synthase [Propionibacteriaceae bacterium]|jgi:thiamine-phosphate pyrophosphorylase|nr:thiamine phosphate synthase [Propionibacteriaceae bacterium]